LKRAIRLGLVPALLAIVCVQQLAVPQQAAAGVKRTAAVSPEGSNAGKKEVAALCGPDEQVIGGGGAVLGGYGTERLTFLTPRNNPLGEQDSFTVRAETPGHHASPFRVAAYAVCIHHVDVRRHQIVRGLSTYSSSVFKSAEARCPGGTVAFGSGAQLGTNSLVDLNGLVGLQLNRVSGPLDISRATAREDVTGTTQNWLVASFAICAEPYGDIRPEGTIAPGNVAFHACGDGRLVHGPGGGGGLTDGGPAYLSAIVPSVRLENVLVEMTDPLHPSIGGMVASATCAL
jgi:hypothetical protein